MGQQHSEGSEEQGLGGWLRGRHAAGAAGSLLDAAGPAWGLAAHGLLMGGCFVFPALGHTTSSKYGVTNSKHNPPLPCHETQVTQPPSTAQEKKNGGSWA